MNKFISSIGFLFGVIMTSLLLIVLAIVYFAFSIWVIKVGARWAGYADISGGYVILTAGIITAAILIGSSIKKY
ncbi:MAG: hypothetical protein WCF78_04665 [archaeon]|jgi:hypothetical protein